MKSDEEVCRGATDNFLGSNNHDMTATCARLHLATKSKVLSTYQAISVECQGLVVRFAIGLLARDVALLLVQAR